MSNAAITAVWEHSQAKGVERLVLLAIADRANADFRAWPGTKDICERTKCSRRAVIRARQSLVKAGELVIERVGGSHPSSKEAHRYLITLPVPGLHRCSVGTGANEDTDRCQDVTTTGALVTLPPVPGLHPNPHVTSKEPPKNHHHPQGDSAITSPSAPSANEDEEFLDWSDGKGISCAGASACLARWKDGKITSSLKGYTLACHKRGEFPEPPKARQKPKRSLPLIERQRIEVLRREPQFKAWMAVEYPGHESSPIRCKDAAIEAFCATHDIEANDRCTSLVTTAGDTIRKL